ncbi:luciferase-like monooxygenase [Mycobacteroides abscessus subsp. bolletii]|nr:luciferase-like monooxygenase [Mycobacteroides abscessus subsp. bolletii]
MAQVAETLEFGVFIPQGWRLDLVGIAPERHWDVMRDLVHYAEGGPWDSVWVYDHFRPLRKHFYAPSRIT